MPKTYSDKERKEIINLLRKSALESIKIKGLRKTTVDDIVASVHIPKGTFYLFYESKELLIYDSIMEQHDIMHKKIEENFFKEKDNCTIDSFSSFLVDSFMQGFDIGILSLLMNGDLEVLIRKLPEDVVADHLRNDEDFFSLFSYIFPNLTKESLNTYSASFRAIFFTWMFKREIGTHFDEVIQKLIKGLVNQMWSENNDSNK